MTRQKIINALVGLNGFDLMQLSMLSAPRLVRETMKMVQTRNVYHKMS